MNDHVFKERGDGSLRFVGDFDALYRSETDPWSQSGSRDDEMTKYYRESRDRLSTLLRSYRPQGFALEVGTGHGYALNHLEYHSRGLEWYGLEVSSVAISRARELFPALRIIEGDITNWQTPLTFDVIVLNQCLWYLLNDLNLAIMNCHRLLNDRGLLVISQAFLRNQRYGRSIIDGFDGAMLTMLRRYSSRFTLIEARHDDSGRLEHDDGLLILRKKDNAVRSDEGKFAPQVGVGGSGADARGQAALVSAGDQSD